MAEFGAEPVTCTLTGSARPGVAKERVLVKAGMAPGLLPQLTMEQLDGTQLFKVRMVGEWALEWAGRRPE